MGEEKVDRSIKNMQVSKKFMSYCMSLQPHPIRGDNTNFHQWIIQKYRQQRIQTRGFPALLFLRPFRPIIAPDRENLTVFPIQITLIVPVRERQIVLRKTIHREAWIYAQMPFCSTDLVSTTTIARWSMLTVNSRQHPVMAKQSSICWNKGQRLSLLSVHGDPFVASPITYKPMRIVANTTPVVQPEFLHVPSRIENLEDSNFRINRVQRPTLVSYTMPSAITKADMNSQPSRHNERLDLFEPSVADIQTLPMSSKALVSHNPSKAQRPAELFYLMSSETASARPKTISGPVRRNGESVFFKQPVMDVQSLPTNPQAPSIDINRLTDQVYQALERRIRLEKQRRGYR
jgi:hypothetical protein